MVAVVIWWTTLLSFNLLYIFKNNYRCNLFFFNIIPEKVLTWKQFIQSPNWENFYSINVWWAFVAKKKKIESEFWRERVSISSNTRKLNLSRGEEPIIAASTASIFKQSSKRCHMHNRLYFFFFLFLNLVHQCFNVRVI